MPCMVLILESNRTNGLFRYEQSREEFYSRQITAAIRPVFPSRR